MRRGKALKIFVFLPKKVKFSAFNCYAATMSYVLCAIQTTSYHLYSILLNFQFNII